MGSDDSASEQGRALACTPPPPPTLHLALLDRSLRVEWKLQWESITARPRLLQQATTGLKHLEMIVAAHQYFHARAVQIQTLDQFKSQFSSVSTWVERNAPLPLSMMKTRDAGGKKEHRVRVGHRPPPRLGGMITACKWCRRGRRGPWWQRTSASKCPPWWEHGQKWTTKTRRFGKGKRTRQPVQKIGNDRNHSGVLGAPFAPPPPSKTGSDQLGRFLTIFSSRNETSFSHKSNLYVFLVSI